MFAKTPAGPLSRMGLQYGWVVIAVTFLVALTNFLGPIRWVDDWMDA